MSSKSFVCLFAVTFAASIAMAGSPPRNSSSAVPQSGATINRAVVTPGGAGFNRAPVTSNTGRWSGGNWRGDNWRGDWHNHDRNRFVFVGSFGFPYGGWGYPGWGYPYSYYPYGYYGGGYYSGGYYGGGYYPGGYPGGYYSGDGYGYGYSGQGSQVAQLQRRLRAAGYYRGSIDGIMGPRTRSALRAYQRDRGTASYSQSMRQPY